ncbi:thiol-disulfide isomerase/thioredoxin [Kribbella aluminosa]|uniref:Thiol-disulfide isomerase/thioredoxin n=1 Tax=Kribbella aluminosa TaxID=416017 RepID=A0ABS4UCU2_9ACTN|nr:TlpA disulfide reductase family protein [Kribbella aluminosa]MBP2349443.1 thiol-disulfide isomerase/thioredoxin [Kribbella aluminosa]
MLRRTAVLVAGVFLVAGCSSGQQAAQNRQGQAGFVSGNGNVSVFAAADRKTAPELTGKTLDDKTWTLSEQKGKVVVLNVWGSWCPPCRKEAPELVAAAKELGPSVQFVGLNTRDLDPAPAKKFVQEFGVQYPNVYDPNGRALLRFRGQISPAAIPTTLVIDKFGKVAGRVVGEVTKQTLLGMVAEAK